MRKRSSAILIAIIFTVFAATACADSENITDGMMKKLERGIVNLLTGWVELPAQIGKGYNAGFMGDEDNKLLGIMMGAFNGVVYSTGRTLSGVADVIGFWTASPEDNKNIGIPLGAGYAWEEGESYNLFDPNFTEAALRPMANKLFRGVGNTIFGFMEVPRQVVDSVSGETPYMGIVKGLWYWPSREISGIFDILSFPFANPEDTIGATFDKKWPWDKAGVNKAVPEGTL